MIQRNFLVSFEVRIIQKKKKMKEGQRWSFAVNTILYGIDIMIYYNLLIIIYYINLDVQILTATLLAIYITNV